LNLPVRAEQIAIPKTVFCGVVAPTAEKVRADVPFGFVAITHKPMVGAVVHKAIRHAASRTSAEVITGRRGSRKAHDIGFVVGHFLSPLL
jgi:hypothetical protein